MKPGCSLQKHVGALAHDCFDVVLLAKFDGRLAHRAHAGSAVQPNAGDKAPVSALPTAASSLSAFTTT